jgi:hypothetical protein
MSSSQREELEGLISDYVGAHLTRMTPLEGQFIPRKVKGKFSSDGKTFVIDLGSHFIPLKTQEPSPELQDQLTMITSILASEFHEVEIQADLRFGGRTIEEVFPDFYRALSQPVPTSFVPGPVEGETMLDNVAINPGHGLYKLYAKGQLQPQYEWKMQRDPHNGVLEDEMTQTLSLALRGIFRERSSEAATFSLRSEASDFHPQASQESGHNYMWSEMSGKYYGEAILPGRTDVWDVTGTTDRNRDHAKDTNSRTRMATALGATSMLSLHTNAVDGNDTASGTLVFHQSGNPESAALAQSVACYMDEIITAQPGYSEWSVGTRIGTMAEVKSTVPNALVEVAYHTTPSDAAALQDPTFRSAAMKGVEKGHRLWRKGKTCQPFAITSMPDLVIPNGEIGTIEVFFEGFPQFPVTMRGEIIECPAGSTCRAGDVLRKDEVPSPLTITYGCDYAPSAPTKRSVLRMTLLDADGVKTNSVDTSITCAKSARTASLARESLRSASYSSSDVRP